MLYSQTQWEFERATIKVGRVWMGVTANSAKGSFNYSAGFFPNDWDVLGIRGQEYDAWAGNGFYLGTTNWTDPIDTFHTAIVIGPVNEFMPIGKVTEKMTNYIRYGFPEQYVDFEVLDFEDFATVDPLKFSGKSYDQIVKVTNENILGVRFKRKIMAFTQTFYNDHVVVDAEFENVSSDTLKDFYINIQSNGYNTLRSNGYNPAPGTEGFDPATTWQHYYGGRAGDSLRVFYEYSADDPDLPGDNMGAPVTAHGGRLLNPHFIWYSILHASQEPFMNTNEDVDDPLQPRVTYIGKDNLIPYNEAGDDYGSSNYYAVRGGYSADYPMSGNTHPGTFHGLNSDETGSYDYAAHPAGTHQANNSKMWASFGPYTFAPGEKIHIAYASGYSGISAENAQKIGKKWMNGTLQEAPDLPDSRTGYFPSNFAYPPSATEMDKVKNRWLSTGIDSVMKSSSRAKWNFNRNFETPASPPPPEYVEITGLGTGVEIRWCAPEAEALPNFDGYRIMRKLSSVDTVYYEEIFDTNATAMADTHIFVDTNVLVGAQYYYYVQAKARIAENDPSAYPADRGKVLYSSRALQPNTRWINPPHFSQDNLLQIAIAPNPYNINDPKLQYYGWTDDRGVQFFNLPAKIDIKIYTENGDHVITIRHDSPVSSGYEHWNMITKNQQVIQSGVYIVVFQAPDGAAAYQKLLVVR